MIIQGNGKNAASNDNAGLARLQWLVRKLSRRDGAALALPLSLALLGTSIAREREAEEVRTEPGAAAQAPAAALQAGDRVALVAGDAVLLEHLLTDADMAAGQVRVALRMIDSMRLPGMRTIEGVVDAAAAGTAAVADINAVAEADMQAQAGTADAMGGEGDAQVLSESASQASQGAAAGPGAPAAEDEDDRGLLWLMFGIGSVATGIIIADKDSDPVEVNTISGQVVKGYVQGAAVYLDLDHDGLPDGDPVYTDAEGRFTLQAGQGDASIVVYGGVDTLTNVPLEGVVLRAPAGSTVVTPLTTLMHEMMRQDSTLDAASAQAKLLEAFGLSLPQGADLRTWDPVAGIDAGGAAFEDQAEAVLNTISSIQSLLSGAGAADELSAANAAISAIAQALLQPGTVDLADADDVQRLLQSSLEGSGVGASDASDLASLSGAIAAVNASLAEASGLGEDALQATRYAFSGFQDLLASIGASASSSDSYDRDISLSDGDLAAAVGAITGGDLSQVIADSGGLRISFAERMEGGRFVLALSPELKFHEGKPDTIDTLTVRFDVEGVLVQMQTRGLDGRITASTLAPDADGVYTLNYADLDKIYFQAPEDFNGVLGADVTVHYVGLDVTDTPPRLGIRIDAVNDAPESADASVSVTEDQPYVFRLADFPFTDSRDAAHAGGANSLAAIRIASLPASGTLLLGEELITAGAIEAGLFVSAADIAQGLLRFVPAADAHGEGYASFQFQVRDDGGTANGGVDLDPAVHTLTLDVAGISDAPVATGGEVSVAEGGMHTFAAADFGFSDVDGDALAAIVIASLPEDGVLYLNGEPVTGDMLDDEGGLTIAAADIRNLTFVPSGDFNGAVSFAYRVRDLGTEGNNLSATATLDISVQAVNDAPVAQASELLLQEDGAHQFSGEDFPFSDMEGDGLAALLITGLPGHGTLWFDGVALSDTDFADGTFVVPAADLALLNYVPAADYHGSDGFSYRLRDSGGTALGGSDTSAEATFGFTIAAVSDTPTISGAAVTLDEDGQHSFVAADFGFSDADGDQLASVIITSLPANGRLVYNGEDLNEWHLGEDGLEIMAADLGQLEFIPAGDFDGSAGFGFKVRDTGPEESNTSSESTLQITVSAVNDAPQFSMPDYSTAPELQAVCAPAFRVNAELEGSQENPRIAALADGGYVVVWTTRSDDGQAVSYAIHGQRFDAAGEKRGAEFRVNDEAEGDQSEPSVVAGPGGTFVVSWTHRVDGDANVVARLFDSEGQPAQPELLLNFHTSHSQIDPALAVNGLNAMAVWTSDKQDGSGYGIYARVNGSAEFRVNTITNFGQNQPAVAALADGSFVVTWTGQDGLDSKGIFARRFTADGVAVDEQEQLVNRPTHLDDGHQAGDQYQSVVTALPDGGYVVIWTGQSQDDASLTDVFGQRFDAQGQPAGDSFLVNAGHTDAEQRDPAVFAVPTGGFVVTWTSWGSQDSSLDVFAQRFGADGRPLGETTLVNSTTDLEQTTPAIAVLNDGTVVIAWQSNTDQGGDNYEVYAQHFRPMGAYFIEGVTGNREDVTPVLIAPTATVSDTELDAQGDWSGARLVIERDDTLDHGRGGHGGHGGRGRGSPDHFEFQAGNGYSVDEHGALLKHGHLLGRVVEHRGQYTVEFGAFGSLDVESYEGIATPTHADVNYVLQHIAYWNSSDNPGESVTLRFRIDDGNTGEAGAQGSGGAQEGWAYIDVQLVNVNDAPVARHNSVRMLEDGTYTFDADDFRFRDAEDDGLRSITITSLPVDGKLYYCGNALRGEDLYGEDGGFTIDASDLGKLVFVPDEDFNGQVEFSYYLRDDGGTERGGQDTSAEATFRIKVAAVNDAPEIELSPYNFVVTTLDDSVSNDGKLSLREALALAKDGDSITFAAELAGGTIQLSGEALEIARNVYINGNPEGDCEAITLATDGSYSAIRVTAEPGSTGVVVSGLNIRGSSDGANEVNVSLGGSAAIVNAGRLTLNEVQVEGYQQQGMWGGSVASVIWNQSGATLNANGLVVSGNSAYGYSSDGAYMAGSAYLIHNEGAMNLVSSTFDNNAVVGGYAEGIGGDAYLILNASEATLAARDLYASVDGVAAGHGDTYGTSGAYAGVELGGECDNELPASDFVYAEPDLRVRFREGSEEPVLVMRHVSVSDVELGARNDGAGDWSGASLRIGARCEEGDDPGVHVVGLADGLGLEFVDGQVLKCDGGEPFVIASYAVDESGALVITFPKNAGGDAYLPTTEDVNNVLRLVTYQNTSEDPGKGVMLAIALDDGNGWRGSQGFGKGREIAEVAVGLESVNDAPEFDFEANPPVVVSREEDEAYVFSASDFPFTDVEGDCLGGILITALPESGVLAVDGRIVTWEQVECGGFLVTAEEIASGLFTFQPAPDFHGAVTFEYKVQDDGGTHDGGQNTTVQSATFAFDVVSINDAPRLALSPTADYTFVVTTLEDSTDPCDGKLSLREALAMACDGDSITFDASLFDCGNAVITLLETLSIDKQVYINGAIAGGRVTLLRDECLDAALLWVDCSVGASHGGAVLQGMQLDGGDRQVSQSALVNEGNLRLHDFSIVAQNTYAEGCDAVGAIDNQWGAVLVATALTLAGNQVAAGEGGDAWLIQNNGKFTVDGLSFNDNTVQGGNSDSQGGDAFLVWNEGAWYESDVSACNNTINAGSGDNCGCESGDGAAGEFGGAAARAAGFALEFVPPALTGTRPDAQVTYISEGEAVLLAPAAVLSDPELGALREGAGNWSGARIEIRRVGGADQNDVFDRIGDDSAIQWNEGTGRLMKNIAGTDYVVGTFSSADGVMTLHFAGHGNAYPTTEDVNALLRSLTYRNSDPEFEGQVELQVTVRDGNLSFDGPQGSGPGGAAGDGVVVGTIQVDVQPVYLGAPGPLSLVEETSYQGDAITAGLEGPLWMTVTLPGEGVAAGNQIRLYRNGEVLASQILTEDHVLAGFVTVEIDTSEMEDLDFAAVTARLARSAESLRESGDSVPFFLTYDTTAPDAPELDPVPFVVSSGAARIIPVGGWAEPFSKVTATAPNGEEVVSATAMADASGRFELQLVVNTPGSVGVEVRAEDQAGNVSFTSIVSEYHFTSDALLLTDAATSAEGYQADVGSYTTFRFASDFSDEGGGEDGEDSGGHVMHGGGGTEWFIGNEFATAVVDLGGDASEYSFTLLEGQVLDDALAGRPGALSIQADMPVYQIRYWAEDREEPTVLFVQAQLVTFEDGTVVRLTTGGMAIVTTEGAAARVHGGAGNERIVGHDGDDVLFGHDGNNILVGNAGNDILVSYGAPDSAPPADGWHTGDMLIGGEGNDLLLAVGDAATVGGSVHMYGGSGEDLFAILPLTDEQAALGGSSSGFDRNVFIHDFVVADDVIDLSALRVDSGDGYRELTFADLDLAGLIAGLATDTSGDDGGSAAGTVTIDLGQFRAADGSGVSGTLTLTLAGAGAQLTEGNFVLSAAESMLSGLLSDGLDELMLQPYPV